MEGVWRAELMLGFLPGLFKDEDDEPKFAVAAAAAAAAAMLLYLLAKVCFFSGMLLCWDTRAVWFWFWLWLWL